MNLKPLQERLGWRKGKRTVIKVNRSREYQSYIGFLNQKSFQCHLYELDWQNQTEILKAFEKFLKEFPDKKICIVWDNAGFHKGKEIKKPFKKAICWNGFT